MEDLDAASLEDVKAFFRTYYAPNNAVLSVVGDVDRDAGPRLGRERYFGADPGQPATSRRCRDMSLPPDARRARVGRRSRTACRCRGSTGASAARSSATARLDALDLAGQILAGGKGSRLHRRLVREERLAQDVALFTLGFVGGASVTAGWATARPGVELVGLETAFWEELERLAPRAVSDDELERAKALTEADELGALAAGRGAGRPAVDVRDAVRRPGADQHACCRATCR